MGEYDDDEDEIAPLPSIRWSWLTPAILGCVVLAEVIEAVGDGVTNLATAMASHSNWRREQKEFQEEAAMAIERITSG